MKNSSEKKILSNKRDKYIDGKRGTLVLGKGGNDHIKGNDGNDEIWGQS